MYQRNIDDAEFKSLAKESVNKMDENKGSGGNYVRDYVDVKYVGIHDTRPVSQNGKGEKPSVIRFLGNWYTGRKDPSDAKLYQYISLKDAQGKSFQLRLPPYDDKALDKHLFYQIFDKVMEMKWADGKNYRVNEVAHPEIFEMVKKGGFKAEDGKAYTYARGWKGQTVLVCNVLDRSIMDWHRANKHSAVLVRSLKEVERTDPVTGATSVQEVTYDGGVPSYGFIQPLEAECINIYGSWEKYDVGIFKLGQKTSPYSLKNFSDIKETADIVPNDDAHKTKKLTELAKLCGTEDIVQVGELTDEELSWERYDLDKIFGVSTYSKIKAKLGTEIKAIDGALGTNFYDRLEKEVEKEKEEWKKLYPDEANAEGAGESTEPTVESLSNEALTTEVAPTVAPVQQTATPTVTQPAPQTNATRATRTPAAAPAGLSAAKKALLGGYNSLTEEEKARIVDVADDPNTGVPVISYTDVPGDAIVDCPTCRCGAPQSFVHCPNCGITF